MDTQYLVWIYISNYVFRAFTISDGPNLYFDLEFIAKCCLLILKYTICNNGTYFDAFLLFMALSHYSVPSHSIRAFSKNGIAKRTFIAGV